jgi:hypothetical protein
MGMRAYAADTFDKIEVLDIGAFLAGLFNPAVVITEPDARLQDFLPA